MMGYFLILRPLNCLITAVSVVVGAWIGLPKIFNLQLLIGMIIGFFTCGFGNVLNDIYDIEIDSINAPHRPLPKGSVKKKYVIYESIFLAAICLILAFLLGFKALILVFIALIMLLLYACCLKKYWPANLVVALLTGFSFLLGGIVNNNIAALFPFAFSVLIHMPREIIKDLIDEAGDRAQGAITCAARIGSQKARILASIYLGMLVLILPLPFIFQTLNWKYIIVMLVFAYPLIIYLIARMIRRSTISDLRLFSRLFKIVMVIGLIAMLI